jgi:DNA-binding NarL/FixJ family response regulator
MADARAIGVVVGRFEDLVARGLRSLIEEDPNLELLAADVAIEQLDEVLGQLPARVAILALEALPSPVAVRALVSRHAGTELVLLAQRPSRIESAQLLAFGAAACLNKQTQGRDVLNAVHLASRGMQLAPREQSGAGGPELLTPREADVLTHLQHSRSNAQIAADLHISVETVRTHARNIYRKLGVGSRRELTPRPAPR